MSTQPFPLDELLADVQRERADLARLDVEHATVDLDVVDQVDGRFVLRPQLRVTAGGELLAVRDVDARDGLELR